MSTVDPRMMPSGPEDYTSAGTGSAEDPGYGWILIAMSAVQFFVVFGIWAKIRAVRWIGVAIAAVDAIAQLIAHGARRTA